MITLVFSSTVTMVSSLCLCVQKFVSPLDVCVQSAVQKASLNATFKIQNLVARKVYKSYQMLHYLGAEQLRLKLHS